jgi:RNA 2',3'-cyclic 3'-phosphodiesterase
MPGNTCRGAVSIHRTSGTRYMRTFIALNPPPEVIDRLAAVGEQIRRIDPKLRCEHREKLHFTLEFLGEKNERWVEECRHAISAALASAAPFSVCIGRIGFFPGPTHPRIIWAGSQPEENEQLCRLASEIKHACAQLGHKADPKPFHPHITLTRVKAPLASGIVDRIAAIEMEPLEFECGSVSIVKSTLAPSGSKYDLLHLIPLAANS